MRVATLISVFLSIKFRKSSSTIGAAIAPAVTYRPPRLSALKIISKLGLTHERYW
ncbi:MAG: hypothetical protein F6K40_29295 [Okeania sp. SIO3I5]|uniref:hypothetical protein n=1 Tax=Okeania sp. SIO3I5 TaxID=2607805 RepID=UPI0013B93FB1|nr:hypothetical protein [Okeania sp. SIO3I5]NEQ40115.1 hypothetical protein [Okeania sp. SIO3I5]